MTFFKYFDKDTYVENPRHKIFLEHIANFSFGNSLLNNNEFRSSKSETLTSKYNVFLFILQNQTYHTSSLGIFNNIEQLCKSLRHETENKLCQSINKRYEEKCNKYIFVCTALHTNLYYSIVICE